MTAPAERVSSFLSRRPLLSFSVSVALLLMGTDSIRDVFGREGHAPITGWTWAAGLLTVYAVVMVFYLPPRVAPPAAPSCAGR